MSIKTKGFVISTKSPVLFKDVFEYVDMTAICNIPKQTNWCWVVKDGMHRLSCLYYLHKNALLEIDENHVLVGVTYG
jgi:hypothetical protein